MSKPEITRIYYQSGAIRYEYHLNGKQHREDGPAYIGYYENGAIEREEYFLNGKQHREDGPAIIYYYENGAIVYEIYCLNDKQATKEQIEEMKFNKQFIIDLEEVLND